MKTTLEATITIEAAAWNRVRTLAALRHRPLPDVLGDLLEVASAEPEPDVPKIDEVYEAPAFLRLFIRRHPGVAPPRD